jgi:hypothetical protein
MRLSEAREALAPLIDMTHVSAMESEICSLLQFELSVKPRTFYQYYFALRELGRTRLRAQGKAQAAR